MEPRALSINLPHRSPSKPQIARTTTDRRRAFSLCNPLTEHQSAFLSGDPDRRARGGNMAEGEAPASAPARTRGGGGGRGRGQSRGRGRGRGGGEEAHGGRRGGGRGGHRGVDGHAASAGEAQARPLVKSAAPPVAGEKAKEGEEGEDVEAEVCFICASPVVHNSVAPCNHRTCHICALRMRALYKTKDCAHCRVCPPLPFCLLRETDGMKDTSSICDLHG